MTPFQWWILPLPATSKTMGKGIFTEKVYHEKNLQIQNIQPKEYDKDR